MTVSVVIPNFNGLKLLETNLPLIIKAVGKAQIIIVDDGSTDGSARFIKKNFPHIKLIEKVTNSGFATTVNLGVKAASGEIILLLNTDIVPSDNFLEPLLKHFSDPKVFAVGCLDESIENGKTVKRGRGIGRFERGFLVHKRGEVDKTDTLWVNGGSGAFRKSIWEKLGGMDEVYDPFYWDDIDLSYRAQKSGYKIVFEPYAIVEHRHEEGSILKNYTTGQIKQIAYRNQLIFVWQNITDSRYLISHFFWIPLHLLKAILNGDMNLIRGWLWALIKLPEILKNRQINKMNFIKKDTELI